MRKDEEILARLRKIAALAARGAGGEAENAAALLHRTAAEHGIDLARLDEEAVSEHRLPIGTEKWRFRLFAQLAALRDRNLVIYMAYDPPRAIPRGRRRPPYNAVKLRCADSLFVELVAEFSVLAPAYERQLKALYRAFLEANGLLLPAGDPCTLNPSEEELQTARDAHRLAFGIDPTERRRQIEAAPAPGKNGAASD